MNMERAPSIEKPLNGAAKAGIIACGLIILLIFYVFTVVSISLLLLLIGLELLVALALTRFAMGRLLIPTMNRHVAVAGIFFRSFYNRKRAEFNLALKPAEAPGLFAILEKLSKRLQMAMPRVVCLEMPVNAWVRLKGFRSGAGTTILGIGYDLLAGLSVAEAEAVLAHELAHAKLIQRGIRNWLNLGLGHLVRLAGALTGEVNGCQRARVSCVVAEIFLRGVDALTRMLSSLVATYSRQEEFAADRVSAEVCGATAARSALNKVEMLASAAQGLPWRDRIAQLQMGGFSKWLAGELTRKDVPGLVEGGRQVFNKYSTHPRLSDRLAALPPATGPAEVDIQPAISLLADPEAAAGKLIAEIQRLLVVEELKDSKLLAKLARKTRRSIQLQPLQLVGVFFGMGGGLCALYGVLEGFSSESIISALVGGALAIVCHRLGRYRDRMELAIPDYAFFKLAWDKKKEAGPGVSEKELEKELRERTLKHTRIADRAKALAAESYAALKRCDYLRAHVAARLCHELDKKMVEGNLALAIASASMGQAQQASWTLAAVRKVTGFRRGSTAWGAGWALLLLGEWAQAEPLIELTRKEHPHEPTLLVLLALCQFRRNKLQSAIASARQACTPAPRNKEHAKYFIGLLLHGGYLREAREVISKLEGQIRGDGELMFLMLRLNLLQRNFPAAEEWTRLIRQNSPAGITLVRLGEAYEAARKSEPAEAFYYEALAAGFYPEARIGLARLEAERQNKQEAQGHLLAALDTSLTAGPESAGPLSLFHHVASLLVSLREPVPDCQAWIARLNGNASPPALANQSFMVYAPGRLEAENYLNAIIDALRKGQLPLIPSIISWQEAPWQQKPKGPVRPGVQGVIV
jgi:Zn-dependent protease with chaperone function/tetratricopeptide (TPR) repeat protein